MNNRSNFFSSFFAALFGLGAGGLSIVMLIFVFFGNAILGGFTWAAAFNSLAQWAGKAQDFAWWHGALFALIPILGRWWIGLLVFLFFKFFVL